jgi:hypothetical protein
VTDPSEAAAPISLLEGDAFQLLFGSIEDLIGYVEAIDVWNHEFNVYDAHGRELVLEAESDIGPVHVAISQADPDPVRLRERLADAVRTIGPTRFGLIDADVDLPALLRALWASSYPRRPFPG